MSTQLRAFRPLSPTQNVAVSAAPQTLTLNGAIGTFVVRLCNIGTQTVYFLPGEQTQTAATLSNAIPLPSGQTEIFTFSQGTQSISVIANGTGSTLYCTIGEGL